MALLLWFPYIKGRRVLLKTAQYAEESIVFSTKRSSERPRHEKQPQTMTLPPPCCVEPNQQPGRLTSSHWAESPSGPSKVKRDSSLKTTFLHHLSPRTNKKRAQVNRFSRCRSVRDGAMHERTHCTEGS